ncbi:MAG TPA: sigma factor-like helix-turn-helix DNA-binding protein [Trebonia sp.]|nr:sigma factor-like helix-turn-helix DNA-binding protein [Trebonia sp.]
MRCYRIPGSAAEAEDMPQETLMAAWRGLNGFEDMPFPEPGGIAGASWVEPYPDELLGDLADGAQRPGTRYAARESISLAFVTALQHLPPRRRAALVLCDVLGFGVAEAAEILDSSAEAVNAALAGARAVIAGQLPPGLRDRSPLPGSALEREVTGRFADALERGDADGIVALLTDDAWLTAPPVPFRYRGRAAAELLSSAPCDGTCDGMCRDGTRRFRLIATRANGQPAFGCYLSDPAAPIAHVHSLIVLTLAADRVSGITRFTDSSVLRLFCLPRTLPG